MNPNEYARMHALETEYWWFAGRRAIIEGLLHKVPSQSKRRDLRLLDIGCGTGANLPMLRRVAGQSGRVFAMDFSLLALDFARTHPESEGVSLLQGDALHLPFKDDCFDVLTMLDVLEHLNDDRRALSEVRRVLRPGGALVFSVPAYQHLWSAHDEALHHFRRYEFRGLNQLLRESGFQVYRLSFAMSLMPPAAWLWRRLILPFQPKRPKEATRHSEGAVLPQLPRPFNQLFIEYLKLEGRIIPHYRFNFGTSLVGIAVKRDK
jgi:ubiquinone/menaquinone biosynthesis C-methylase UbiE